MYLRARSFVDSTTSNFCILMVSTPLTHYNSVKLKVEVKVTMMEWSLSELYPSFDSPEFQGI